MNGIWMDEVTDGVVTEAELILDDMHIWLYSHYNGKNTYTYMIDLDIGGYRFIDMHTLDCGFNILGAKKASIQLIKNLSDRIINGLSLLDIGE